ncbi:hypothetical protein R3I94_008684 [Phoxinus phoxinus]
MENSCGLMLPEKMLL